MRAWHDIGIALPYGATGEVRTTCPQCSPSRLKSRVACLAVNADKGTWYCWHCGWKGRLRSRRAYHGLIPVSPRLSWRSEATRRAALNCIWQQSRRITAGDPVNTYLRQRGLDCGPVANMPAVLRYHPRLMHLHDTGERTYHPAMLAAVSDPHGHFVSIHRTYLTYDGHKADIPTVKKLMSPATPGGTRGGAIRLYETTATLAVTEGIETALAVHLTTGLPVWAAISTIGMKALVVPDVVRIVIICADHDRSGAGLDAARTLARRMLAEHRRVKILMPDTPGTDWADSLVQDARYA
jgi:putative DNA primase/helicase